MPKKSHPVMIYPATAIFEKLQRIAAEQGTKVSALCLHYVLEAVLRETSQAQEPAA